MVSCIYTKSLSGIWTVGDIYYISSEGMQSEVAARLTGKPLVLFLPQGAINL